MLDWDVKSSVLGFKSLSTGANHLDDEAQQWRRLDMQPLGCTNELSFRQPQDLSELEQLHTSPLYYLIRDAM
ncbi:hypothetical protein [Halopseudomonas bauzanensis]|uniref:Uncharacterized protein n=1 Tax=Halopseudomonas bauzanensis TaxID=653930 RepID=A0A4U0YSA6_9GAMM|nr:hypothetical protein [Halopseudomonas bauzanensis]TKA92651.1 hypothetical protein FA869_00200 [Halopseudomonas bauzanensis]